MCLTGRKRRVVFRLPRRRIRGLSVRRIVSIESRPVPAKVRSGLPLLDAAVGFHEFIVHALIPLTLRNRLLLGLELPQVIAMFLKINQGRPLSVSWIIVDAGTAAGIVALNDLRRQTFHAGSVHQVDTAEVPFARARGLAPAASRLSADQIVPGLIGGSAAVAAADEEQAPAPALPAQSDDRQHSITPSYHLFQALAHLLFSQAAAASRMAGF